MQNEVPVLIVALAVVCGNASASCLVQTPAGERGHHRTVAPRHRRIGWNQRKQMGALGVRITVLEKELQHPRHKTPSGTVNLASYLALGHPPNVVPSQITTDVHPPQGFRDADQSNWAYQATENLRAKGIVLGYPDGYYRGKRTLTRYEFAIALDRALQAIMLTPGPPGEKGETGPQGPQGEKGEAGPPGASPEELDTFRRLASEFRSELGVVGSDVTRMQQKIDTLEKLEGEVRQYLADVCEIEGLRFPPDLKRPKRPKRP